MEKSSKYITISVTAFICYCNTLWGGFVFDDSEAVVKNKDVKPFTPLGDIFKNDFWGSDILLKSSHKSYRPLTILSYRLNIIYSNNVIDPFQFHATNVILYGLLCLLTIPIYGLFIKKRKHEDVNEVVFLSTLLFTVHPVHSEAVSQIVGRADILSSILSLIALLIFHGFVIYRSLFLFGLLALTVVAAVLCKETAIMILAVCAMYDLFYERKRKRTWTKVFNIPFLGRILCLIILGILILHYRLKIMNYEGPTFGHVDNPAAFSESLFTRIFSYNYIYFLNFLILLWPYWLCFDWSMGCVPLILEVGDYRIIFVFLFWLLCAVCAYKNIQGIAQTDRINAPTMGLCLTVLPFLPASNLLLTVGFVIAERTLLLPSMGFCFLVAIGFSKLENIVNNKYITRTMFYGLCVIFAGRTILRNKEWLREEDLFLSALDVCPLNAKVHYNIAKLAADNDNKELAQTEYRHAIRLNPQYEQAMNNLANLLRENMEFVEAEVLLREAIEIRPNFAAAWMNLGIVLTNLNNSEEAEHCYKTAIMHRNKYPDCYYNLGNLYLEQRRNREALKAWEMAVMYRPTHIAAWSNTLVLLDSMNRLEEVLELGQTALHFNPTSAPLHFSIANTLGKVQQFEKAEKHFLEAINLNPQNALYYSNLGVLYHRWGILDKAREMYKKALFIDPSMKNTEVNLEKITNFSGK